MYRMLNNGNILMFLLAMRCINSAFAEETPWHNVILSAPRRYHIITYASEHGAFINAAMNLVRSAKSLGGFNTSRVYTDQDIDPLFRQRNVKLFSDSLHGKHGAYSWKPYIIGHYLHNYMNNSDILVYMDAKYEFSREFTTIALNWTATVPYIGLAQSKPGAENQIYIEKKYSKKEAFIIMGSDFPTLADTNQAWAGFLAIRKSFYATQFISEWITYSQGIEALKAVISYNLIFVDIDHRVIGSTLNTAKFYKSEIRGFKGNRHDQTVLSLAAKKWKLPMRFIPKDMIINHRRLRTNFSLPPYVNISDEIMSTS